MESEDPTEARLREAIVHILQMQAPHGLRIIQSSADHVPLSLAKQLIAATYPSAEQGRLRYTLHITSEAYHYLVSALNPRPEVEQLDAAIKSAVSSGVLMIAPGDLAGVDITQGLRQEFWIALGQGVCKCQH